VTGSFLNNHLKRKKNNKIVHTNIYLFVTPFFSLIKNQKKDEYKKNEILNPKKKKKKNGVFFSLKICFFNR